MQYECQNYYIERVFLVSFEFTPNWPEWARFWSMTLFSVDDVMMMESSSGLLSLWISPGPLGPVRVSWWPFRRRCTTSSRMGRDRGRHTDSCRRSSMACKRSPQGHSSTSYKRLGRFRCTQLGRQPRQGPRLRGRCIKGLLVWRRPRPKCRRTRTEKVTNPKLNESPRLLLVYLPTWTFCLRFLWGLTTDTVGNQLWAFDAMHCVFYTENRTIAQFANVMQTGNNDRRRLV